MDPKKGFALIAAKSYYFGLNGGISPFENYLTKKWKEKFKWKIVHRIEDGKSNIREILVICPIESDAIQNLFGGLEKREVGSKEKKEKEPKESMEEWNIDESGSSDDENMIGEGEEDEIGVLRF